MLCARGLAAQAFPLRSAQECVVYNAVCGAGVAECWYWRLDGELTGAYAATCLAGRSFSRGACNAAYVNSSMRAVPEIYCVQCVQCVQRVFSLAAGWLEVQMETLLALLQRRQPSQPLHSSRCPAMLGGAPAKLHTSSGSPSRILRTPSPPQACRTSQPAAPSPETSSQRRTALHCAALCTQLCCTRHVGSIPILRPPRLADLTHALAPSLATLTMTSPLPRVFSDR